MHAQGRLYLKQLSLAVLSSVLLASSYTFAESRKVTFDEIEELVKKQNLHTKGAELQSSAAQQKKGYLKRSFLPKVNANAGYEHYRTGTQDSRNEPHTGIEARLNLYNGGRDSIEELIIRARAAGANYQAEQVFREEVLKARIAFWELVASRERIILLDQELDENRAARKVAANRISAGIATSTDELEFELHDQQLKREMLTLKLNEQAHQRELAILVGYDDETRIDTVKIVDHIHKAQTEKDPEIAFSHPQVKEIQMKHEEAAYESDKAKRWWSPEIDLYASHNLYPFREREFSSSSDRNESIFGIELSINLFDGAAGKIEASEQALQAAGLEAEHRQTALELQAAIHRADEELELKHKLIHEFENTGALADKYYRQTLEDYQRGIKDSPAVLSALERMFELKKQFSDLRLDYQIANANLASVVGEDR